MALGSGPTVIILRDRSHNKVGSKPDAIAAASVREAIHGLKPHSGKGTGQRASHLLSVTWVRLSAMCARYALKTSAELVRGALAACRT